jgi:hypothetical protein
MVSATRILLHLAVLGLAALAALGVDVSTAYAQSNACARLSATLDTLTRNGNYRGVDDNTADARRVARDVQRNESAYVRQGCNDDARAGRALNGQCRQLARKITQGRAQYDKLSSSVDTGNAIAEQREAVLQEMVRFGCDNRSSARVQRDRGNLFDQLFDMLQGNETGNEIRGDEFNPFGDYHTVRTLCVRKTDGFYWPISYSTLVDYVPNDAEECRAQCPGLDVDLYYYDNPGQEPEQMINQFGEPYASLPNAFRFRTDFDRASRCTAPTDYGSITIASLEDGRTRPMITFLGQTFPLPVRDPRTPANNIIQAPVETVAYVDVPLPRPRPAAPGEEPRSIPVAAPVAANQPARIVQFGDKRVRIVGPETPYAPEAAKGT